MDIRNSRATPRSPGAPRDRRGPTFEFLVSLFVFSAVVAGCAAPGEPYERKPLTPEAVTDLAAAQSGDDVSLTFTLPQQAVDHRPLKESPAIEIYRDFVSLSGSDIARVASPANPTLLVTIPADMVNRYTEQGHIHYADSLRAEDFAQHPECVAIYTIRTQISEKKPSASSNAVAVRVHPAPDAIGDLRVEVTHTALILSWSAPQKTLTGSAPSISGYRIYRGEAQPGSATAETVNPKAPLVKIAETAAAPFRDEQFEFGKTYVYSVRSVVQYPSESLESAASNPAVVATKDTFAPVMPQGLLVVLVPAQGETAAHLELSWAINPETDIAGYRVYRSDQADTPGTRLNTELLLTPAFRDMNVQPGHRYFYSVTAVDRSGNESPVSAVVSGGVPAESQSTP